MCHKANIQALKEDLLKWNSDFVTKDTSLKTVDKMYTEFQTALNSVMNSHIQAKIIKRNQTISTPQSICMQMTVSYTEKSTTN